MTSDPVFVWLWLPGATEPVPAGRLDPGCIADAAPDAWGQRVILHRLLHRSGAWADTADVEILTYLMESSSDRGGALDFQPSPTAYHARLPDPASLDDLAAAAGHLAEGEPIPACLEQALLHGSSIGGARPKAALTDPRTGVEVIAKFGLRSDPYPVVKAEAASMLLAAEVGVDTARVEVTEALGRDVLLVERFDRTGQGERRMVLSLLTLLGLDETVARYASYHRFADLIRVHGTDPAGMLRQLFRRVVVNVAISNTDDHARNHAVFWDGRQLALTPAYDLCPQLRAGSCTELAIAIGRDGAKAATFATCAAASEVFLLSRHEARSIITEVIDGIREGWDGAAERAHLTAAQQASLLGRQILDPAAFEGWPPAA